MVWSVGADEGKEKGMQIVCIGLETQRDGICNIWDVIEQHEDDVSLTGQGYALFEVIKIANLTKSEVETITDLSKPEKQTDLDGNEFWYDSVSANWYQIIISPKYQLTTRDFTQQDIVTLKDELIPLEVKIPIIRKILHNITLYQENKEIIMSGGA